MNIKYTLTYDGYEFGLGSKKWIQDPVLQVFLCIVLVNYWNFLKLSLLIF